MHPAVAALSPEEADAMVTDGLRLGNFMEGKGMTVSEVIRDLLCRAEGARAEPPPIPVRPQRPDTLALLETMQRSARLPPRVREVATLCLLEGLSLDDCAARLGIKRETVRVHLRRLRSIYKRNKPAIDAALRNATSGW